ncbi:MAG TPA: thiamine pyrophosphate-dependent enzyme, partial [Myxococcota bacterium]|nr:thiamine pyrophosphate-dependent enzyme [Myxococcota bacterium]
NLAYFQISCAGHEATLAAASMHLKPGHDWFFPYYRDRTLCLGLGVTPTEMMQQTVGAAADPASGGRQMPSHWGHPKLNIVSESSPTGVQYLSAVGCAEAGALWAKTPDPQGRFEADEVVYCSSGEGTTSEGIFFEALNTACIDKLPVIFHIEDNGYAISVPVEKQTPGGSITQLLQGYPDLLRLEFDGCDPEASFRAWEEGVAHARARRGPVLMHAHVIRPYSHSLSDDERLYRTAAERAEQDKRDPIGVYRGLLLRELEGAAGKLEALEAEVDREVQEAKTAALASPPPKADSARLYVFSPDIDPTADAFATPVAAGGADDKTMVDLINACLADEMARNAAIVVFGEDVADASRPEALEEVKGKGGVFKVTYGLQRKFGAHRVFNSPLAEANIVGRAVGMALRGIKPVVEIQFFDYIWPAMMQIRSEVALMRWRSNNGWKCPLVIRSTYGGYLKGGAVYHSQTGESI